MNASSKIRWILLVCVVLLVLAATILFASQTVRAADVDRVRYGQRGGSSATGYLRGDVDFGRIPLAALLIEFKLLTIIQRAEQC